jgi:hypothetical protein
MVSAHVQLTSSDTRPTVTACAQPIEMKEETRARLPSPVALRVCYKISRSPNCEDS